MSLLIEQIQFKRVLNYEGSFADALICVKTKLDPVLENGEPIIVSYKENDKVSYFLAIGIDKTANPAKVQISPLFDDLNTFANYINSIVVHPSDSETNGDGITDKNISEDSQISVSKDSDGNYILRLKASIISADSISASYINTEDQTVEITQNEFNILTNDRLNKIENAIKWQKI